MPIYEFYCSDCHTIYNFFARRPDTQTRPKCPRCGRPRLERKFSRFAISKGRSEPESEDEDLPPGFDEEKMGSMLEQMEQEMGSVDEENPRQMAHMLRRLYDGMGLEVGGGMEEAIRRMEAGEDPDKIEEELGDELDEDDVLFAGKKPDLAGLRKRLQPPNVDETLYDL